MYVEILISSKHVAIESGFWAGPYGRPLKEVFENATLSIHSCFLIILAKLYFGPNPGDPSPRKSGVTCGLVALYASRATDILSEILGLDELS